MIELVNVVKQLKKTNVLDGINYKFEKGKIYGLSGRNGSGKTMLLRAIAGLIYLTEGKIFIDGKQMNKDIDFYEEMGLIIEQMTMLPQFTGVQNLNILAKIRKKASEDDIKNTLSLVGLDPEDKRKVREYSLGMKQKLNIAQALFENPKLLLLDEPTNALDEASVHNIRDILLQKKKEGVVTIIASHNKEDLAVLCDEIIEMEDGKIR